jgi:hypothetical protein
MAVTYRSASANNATTYTVTITKPTGTVENDILLAIIYAVREVTTPTLSPPDANWTSIALIDYNTTRRWECWWKRAGASEEASYTFSQQTGSSSYSMKGTVSAYSGCITTGSPIDQYSNTSDAGTVELTVMATSITPTVSPSLAVYLADGALSLTGCTIDNGFTERYEATGSNILNYIATKALSSTSAVGNTTATSTGTGSANKSAFLVNLKEPSQVVLKSYYYTMLCNQ